MSLPIPTLPSGTGAYTLIAGGRAVNLPNTISSDDEPIDGRTYHEEIPGMDGLYSIRMPNFGGRSITLSGYIMDDTVMTDVRRVLGFKRLTLVRDGRYLPADITNVSAVKENSDLYRLEVGLSSPRFYWESAAQTEVTGSPASVDNAGDLSAYPLIIVTAGSGGFDEASFWINGRRATYTGSVAEAGKVVIDCDALSAKVNGENGLDGMNSSFFVNPPVLLPGTNSIETSFDGTATYEVRYFGRYL